jgi:hypothetical protein
LRDTNSFHIRNQKPRRKFLETVDSFKRNPMRLELFLSGLFSGNPVAYVRRTMEKLDPFCLTNSEEANYLHVDQTDSVEVQLCLRSAVLDLSFQLIQVL